MFHLLGQRDALSCVRRDASLGSRLAARTVEDDGRAFSGSPAIVMLAAIGYLARTSNASFSSGQ
jgi:hypothetical protein